MKNKRGQVRSALFLLEMTVALLILGICGSICASLFVKADGIALESQALSQAVILAENQGEELKSCRKEPMRLPETGISRSYFDKEGKPATVPQRDGYLLQIQSERSPTLYSAALTVEWQGKELCRLPICVALPYGEGAAPTEKQREVPSDAVSKNRK